MKTNINVLGCGGIASYLVHPLARMASVNDWKVTLIDGDKFEERNLARQLFSARHIGMFKANALAKLAFDPLKVDVDCVTKYVKIPSDVPEAEITLCCPDNMAARKVALESKSQIVIVGGNEVTDAEAYVFHPSFAGHEHLDPRIYYREAFENEPAIEKLPGEGCTSEAVITAAPQTPLANMQAACFMLTLLSAWKANLFIPSPHSVFRISTNGVAVQSMTIMDAMKKRTA